MNIYIKNLDTNFTDENLRSLFIPFGEVASAHIENDVFTGTSRGFGYVEMEDEVAALKAIGELNGSVINGKTLSVQQAEPRPVHKGSYKVGNGTVTTYKFRKNR